MAGSQTQQPALQPQPAAGNALQAPLPPMAQNASRMPAGSGRAAGVQAGTPHAHPPPSAAMPHAPACRRIADAEHSIPADAPPCPSGEACSPRVPQAERCEAAEAAEAASVEHTNTDGSDAAQLAAGPDEEEQASGEPSLTAATLLATIAGMQSVLEAEQDFRGRDAQLASLASAEQMGNADGNVAALLTKVKGVLAQWDKSQPGSALHSEAASVRVSLNAHLDGSARLRTSRQAWYKQSAPPRKPSERAALMQKANDDLTDRVFGLYQRTGIEAVCVLIDAQASGSQADTGLITTPGLRGALVNSCEECAGIVWPRLLHASQCIMGRGH